MSKLPKHFPTLIDLSLLNPLNPLSLDLTSMDALTLLNSDHRIILSCTKSVRVLFERKKSHRLKPQYVTYNGQVIPSSPSVKFLGITFDSALTFWSHFHTVTTLARHRPLKLNSIFSSTFGPLPHPPLQILHPFIVWYGVPARCVASPAIQLSWKRIQLISFREHFPFHPFHPQRQKMAARLPSTHPRQKPVPSQMLLQVRNATHPQGTGLYRQSHSRQMQH